MNESEETVAYRVSALCRIAEEQGFSEMRWGEWGILLTDGGTLYFGELNDDDGVISLREILDNAEEDEDFEGLGRDEIFVWCDVLNEDEVICHLLNPKEVEQIQAPVLN
jgi:hypothetical protein